jgi:2'-5' RNA ligase
MLSTYETGRLQAQPLMPLDRLWTPALGGDRLLFIARPDAAMRETFDVSTREQGIQAGTGLSMFPLVNWHQTLSDHFIDSADTRALLMRAGQRVQMRGFTLALDRLRMSPNERDSTNVELCCSQEVEGLKQLLVALKAAIAGQDLLTTDTGHRPHVTLSYRDDAEVKRQQTRPIRAIEWAIEAFELVVGRGDPYRYQTLGRWELATAAPRVSQTSLF